MKKSLSDIFRAFQSAKVLGMKNFFFMPSDVQGEYYVIGVFKCEVCQVDWDHKTLVGPPEDVVREMMDVESKHVCSLELG